MSRSLLALLLACLATVSPVVIAAEPVPRAILIDFAKELGPVAPRIGFLGGLRDDTPEALVAPLNPSLWRIGHQFRGRIAAGLPGAIDRVQGLGATYKLVMSDLIHTKPGDFAAYEAEVKKLVAQVGVRSSAVIWEPTNEPDIAYKPIDGYYALYAHAFKALREADPKAQICGPGFAFPTYDKYKAFLDYCRQQNLECNYLAWHCTSWDPAAADNKKAQLSRLREFVAQYGPQKIREIHCDEWGGPTDKPGRLHPGRAVVWFYYLESVCQVDRACRANWGKADDYLGGLISPANEPYPVYHAHRFYGSTKGQTRVSSTGNGPTLAALASKADGKFEVLLGSIAKDPADVTFDLKGLPADALKLEIDLLPATELDAPLIAANIPHATNFAVSKIDGGQRVTLRGVEANQAYHLLLSR